MFKVVLFAVLAAAVAEPSALLFSQPASLLSYSSVVEPATTTITKQASSVVHPSPYYYSTPLAYTHLIKKRSAPLAYSTGYYAPTTYIASAPYLTSAFTPVFRAPYVATASLAYTAPAHFIKKRSAPLIASSFIAPSSYSTQSRVDVHSSPLITSYTSYATPITYSNPFFTPFFYKK